MIVPLHWGSIIIIFLLWLCFKKIFEKFSWKFLAWLFILSNVLDAVSTIFFGRKHGHEWETNPVLQWLLLNVHLPDIIVMSVFFSAWTCLFLAIFRILWRNNDAIKLSKTRAITSQIIAKIFLCSFSLGHIIAATFNFYFYFFY